MSIVELWEKDAKQEGGGARKPVQVQANRQTHSSTNRVGGAGSDHLSNKQRKKTRASPSPFPLRTCNEEAKEIIRRYSKTCATWEARGQTAQLRPRVPCVAVKQRTEQIRTERGSKDDGWTFWDTTGKRGDA